MKNGSELTLIELKPHFPGHEKFFGPWIYRGNLTYVVDVGPASCSEELVSALIKMGIDMVDYVLLTHIHIDHAGGLSRLLSAYPQAKVVCHDHAVKHLTNPSRLMEDSQQVLGELAEMYGKMLPVPRERIIPHSLWADDTIKIVETPGHAPHHLCFLHDGMMFVGEAAGMYHALPGGNEYHRPATPARFFFDKALSSIESLLELGDFRICYAHYGMLPSSQNALVAFEKQLLQWREIACRILRSYNGLNIEEYMIQTLLREDANLQGLRHMDEETMARELDFMHNSVKGFLSSTQENCDVREGLISEA